MGLNDFEFEISYLPSCIRDLFNKTCDQERGKFQFININLTAKCIVTA